MNDEQRSQLAGRRVVVTRAADQADALADLLATRGAVPVVVPLIQVVDDPAGAAALAATDPAPFDWIVVTSPNGAERVVAWLTGHPGSAPRLAAVGTATAAVLADAGHAVGLVPRRQSAAGLLDELPEPDREGRAVLVVQAVDAEPTLVDGLCARHWRVEAIAPHRSTPASPSAGLQLAALAADAVLFASGSAARAWVAVFGQSTPPIAIAIGPSTAAVAEAAGLKITAVAADHSLGGMVDTLERCVSGEQ